MNGRESACRERQALSILRANSQTLDFPFNL